MNIGEVLGTVTIEAVSNGSISPTPRVTVTGSLTSGWLDKYAPFIYRQVEQANAQARLSAAAATAETTTPEAPESAPRRRRSA